MTFGIAMAGLIVRVCDFEREERCLMATMDMDEGPPSIDMFSKVKRIRTQPIPRSILLLLCRAMQLLVPPILPTPTFLIPTLPRNIPRNPQATFLPLNPISILDAKIL